MCQCEKNGRAWSADDETMGILKLQYHVFHQFDNIFRTTLLLFLAFREYDQIDTAVTVVCKYFQLKFETALEQFL